MDGAANENPAVVPFSDRPGRCPGRNPGAAHDQLAAGFPHAAAAVLAAERRDPRPEPAAPATLNNFGMDFHVGPLLSQGGPHRRRARSPAGVVAGELVAGEEHVRRRDLIGAIRPIGACPPKRSTFFTGTAKRISDVHTGPEAMRLTRHRCAPATALTTSCSRSRLPDRSDRALRSEASASTRPASGPCPHTHRLRRRERFR